MDENLCKVCATNEGKYVCPRCNLLYCSVACYQARLHLRCSEEFYKENVLEQMSLNSDDPEDALKIRDILYRIHTQNQSEENDIEEESLDSDDEIDIAERLGSVCLDDADAVWDKLSEEEKQEFVELVQNGCPESVVPLWEPWWMYRKPKNKIEVVELIAKEASPDYVMKCPTVKNLLPLSDITKRPPAPCVVWNVINVIGSYSYMMRYFNGEPLDFISEAVNLLISISGNLHTNRNYECYETAVEEISYEVVQRTWLDGSEHALSRMKEDVQKILHGPEELNQSFYLQAALSDIMTLMEKAKNDTKKKDNDSEDKKTTFSKQFHSSGRSQSISKDKLKICIKKVEYYLSWVKSCVGTSPSSSSSP